MCGIIAYIGNKEAYPILMKGLKRLEYRGYDSAGIALLNGGLRVYKVKGKVEDLEHFIDGRDVAGSVGMGHTRWATHGEPNDVNAHPHVSGNGRIAVIHNGIIENYASLKDVLLASGHEFASDTDTEVLVHLIEEIQVKYKSSLEEAVRKALSMVIGAYAIVLMDKEDPDRIVAARKGSPLVVGLGEGEFYIASDASPIIEYTKKVVYLNDEEIVSISRKDFQIRTISNIPKEAEVKEIDLAIEALEKGGFEHFMLKEIYQQPSSVSDCMRGRVNAQDGWLRLGGLEEHKDRLKQARRLIIIGCGTSWHAGLIGEYLFEELARMPVEVEYASEFRYRNPIIHEDDVVIAISQSGETADTLAAVELARSRGAFIYGVVNVVGSSIARSTNAGSYIHAGPEIGVASTKAFTAQVTLLSIMAIVLGKARGTISSSYYQKLIHELSLIPGKIDQVLKQADKIHAIAEVFQNTSNAIYLGRGYNFPVALEGALKLKEISYIHAEGYPAAEMKHGPIALIDEKMPVIVIANNKHAYDKVVSNVQEIKARKGVVIAIITEGDTQIRKMADYYIEIPEVEDPLSPLVSVIPLQLLSYYIATLRGCDVDQPRNLAKSVTVE
jgi:glutamine---fructose-6-phosphate transaminase (isomerizing)